ncbi:MAG: alpha/beta hydrolase [Nitriliruptor sp.]|nr:MAG: alpha/beta hydrolase [Nitriliruptor sp.]
MPSLTVNGVRLAYQIHGTGEIPLVMVHGSWLAGEQWDPVVSHVAESFRVLTYDRRGHGDSERPTSQGSMGDSVADLAALIEQLGLAPAWVAANSLGASITLRLAGQRPDLFAGLTAHEPPLYSLVADDPVAAPVVEAEMRTDAAVAERIASGDHAGAAEQFAEALGPGMWTQLPPEARQTMVENAPAFRDEVSDPTFYDLDLDRISAFPRPALLTFGDQSPPSYAPVITKLAEALPSVEVSTLPGVGHVPHMEHPETYVDALTAFVNKHTT